MANANTVIETIEHASMVAVETERDAEQVSPEAESYRQWAVRAAAEVAEKRKTEPKPSDLRPGARVAWLRDTRFQVKATETCLKCNGTGAWVNPRNDSDSDKRSCFGCNGTGERTGGKLQGENGKPVWSKVAKGTIGEVISWHSFGQFYRNGYNVPNRENTSVKVKLDDSGKVVSATLAALRLV